MSINTQIKQAAATAMATFLPLRTLFGKKRNRYIFAYHRVVTTEVANKYRMQKSMWISPETFSDDLAWMKENGEIVDLDTILDYSYSHTKPLFAITFDDGWIDNYQYAYPILKQHSAPATIFLVSNAIETGHIFWVEDFLYKVALKQDIKNADELLAKLQQCATKHDINVTGHAAEPQAYAESFIEQLKPVDTEKRQRILLDVYAELELDQEAIADQILSWEQVIEMSHNNIQFGSHTHTHEILQYSSRDSALQELKQSKTIISEKLNSEIKHFCYPNARYNSESPGYVRDTGYSHGFRIHNLPLSQIDEPFLVPRFLLNEAVCKSKDYLLCKLLQLPKF